MKKSKSTIETGLSGPRYEIGDVVKLRSGGPWLTIYLVRSDGTYDVSWFAGEELRRDAFSEPELESILEWSIKK